MVGLSGGISQELAQTKAPSIPSTLSPRREDLPSAFRKSTPGTLEDLQLMEKRVERLVPKVSPAVVAVLVGNSGGSGVVISPEGLVLCAAHVCVQPNQSVIFHFPDGRKAKGITLGTNHEMDSGLMQITDAGPWPFASLADPNDQRVGDWVLALGHPGGYVAERSVVVRLGRILRTGDFIQTDCTLMAGDSGGPLFDMFGHVIAIHSRISEATTENFHVPLFTFLDTWPRLARGENWGMREAKPEPTIGMRAEDSDKGCRVSYLRSGGPAAEAGVKEDDIIQKVDKIEISESSILTKTIRDCAVGQEIQLTVKRNGQELTLKVKVEARRFRGRPGRLPR